MCHYRKITGDKDNGWMNGLGGMQFVMNLEGHAGHTYNFDFHSLSGYEIAEFTKNPWFKVKVSAPEYALKNSCCYFPHQAADFVIRFLTKAAIISTSAV